MTEEADGRLKKELGVDRTSRAMEDRPVTERRDVSDDDRLRMFQEQLFNDALPDIPDIPGYHVCWLTTTNQRDSIQKRAQLGYEPVRPEDAPGLEFATVNSGEMAGLIVVEEMVAYKLPMRLYQAFMKEAHYSAPLREEQKLAEVADSIREQAERSKSRIIEEEGLEDIRLPAPRQAAFE